MANGDLPVIASLWVGSDLTWIEQLSMQSFLDMGHHFILYHLHPIVNVPKGVELRPVSDIFMPPFDISDNDRLKVAVYSDVFRLHLSLKTSFIWVDADVCALAPFAFDQDHVFGEVYPNLDKPNADKHNKQLSVQNSVLRLPASSPALAGMLDFVSKPNPIAPWAGRRAREEAEAQIAAGKSWNISALPWASSGPKALTYFLKQSGEAVHAQPRDVFNRINYDNHEKLFENSQEYFEQPGVVGLHFFGVTKRILYRYPTQGLPPHGSYWELLCQRHNIKAEEAPIKRVKGFY